MTGKPNTAAVSPSDGETGSEKDNKASEDKEAETAQLLNCTSLRTGSALDRNPMEKIILACDESGAKGYADQGEACDGEVGVFAGIIVPDSQLASVEADFGAIQDKYRPATGKLHIADLSPGYQDALRGDIYAAIRKHQLPCFWYAVHVEGFHAIHPCQVPCPACKGAVRCGHNRVGAGPVQRR